MHNRQHKEDNEPVSQITALLEHKQDIITPEQEYTNIYGSVFVQGAFMNRAVMKMFIDRGGFTEAKSHKDADYIVWTGGEDINPVIYKERAIQGTYYSNMRDLEDIRVYNESRLDAVKVGICRGAQLLCALNGGKLWQDCDKHSHGGLHDIKDVVTGEVVKVNSLHHQQMILPPNRGLLLAYTRLSTMKESYERDWKEERDGGDLKEVDIEACWFEETRSLCYQPHPEFSHKETRRYFFNLIDRYSFDTIG
jgi:GMP synthase-like glutamine amidotransferase